MYKHFITAQFLKFTLVGISAAFLHWLSRLILSNWMPFSLAVAWSYGVGIIVAFILNAIYVFPDSDKARLHQMRDFSIVNIAFFPVVWALSLIFNKGLVHIGMVNHSENVAHALAIPIPVLATFLIYKFFAFRDNSTIKQAD